MDASIVWTYGLWTGTGVERLIQAYTTRAYSDLSYDRWTEGCILDHQGRVVAILAMKILGLYEIAFAVPAELSESLVDHLNRFMRFLSVQFQWDPPSLCDLIYSPPRHYPWLVQVHQVGRFTIHDLSCDVLGLVNFHKGCYLGQEIVARVQSRIVEHKKRFSICHLKLDKSEFEILYSGSQFAMGVLPRLFWSCDGVLHVWDKPENDDMVPLDSI